MSDKIQLIQLIGTECCSYCSKLTECLTLNEDSSVCEECISSVFKEYRGDEDDDYASTPHPSAHHHESHD